ncbi:hypothetical protein D3C87_1239680 [compost metagenome]
MPENIQDHLRRTAMGHPVFRVHQQRKTAPAEYPLHGFNQLDAEDRRRRNDDRTRVVQQFLLQFAQGFPVEQAGRLLEVHFAAPASGAGVDHHHGRGGRQHVMPVLKLQQVIDQIILNGAVEVTLVCAVAQRAGLIQHSGESIRIVAPALAQHVRQQRVADDAPGERMAVGRFLPLRGKVPVIGDVVVVENHQRRQMRQRPRDVAKACLEGIDARLFKGIALEPFRRQCRCLGRDQGPGHWRPDQHVHGHHFGEGHQVIVGTAAGENRLARATEKSLAQGFIALQCRQQIRAVVVTGRMLVEPGAVADHRAFEVFPEQAQALDQGVNRPQHRPRDIVGVDLIARHHQQCRAVLGGVFLRQQPVDAQQAVCRRVMGLAARAVQQLVDPCAQDEVRATGVAIQQVRRPVSDALFCAIDQQVIVDRFIAGQGAIELHIDQVHKGMSTHCNHRALPGIETDIADALQAQGQRQRPGTHQPQHQPRGFQTPQQRAGQDWRQGLVIVGQWQRVGHPGSRLLGRGSGR